MAAYVVSEALGWEFVPPTVIRDGPMGVGMVQLFIDHEPSEHYLTLAEAHAGLFRRVLKITGRSESDVDTVAAPVYTRWLDRTTPIRTTILAVSGQIELHLAVRAPSRAEADAALEPAARELSDVLGDIVYSTDGRPLEAVVGGSGYSTVGVRRTQDGGPPWQPLDAGLPVFSEKPLAFTLAEMDGIDRRLEGSQTPRLQLGYMKLYDPAVMHALAAAEGRGYGTPRAVDVTVLHPSSGSQLAHAGLLSTPAHFSGDRTAIAEATDLSLMDLAEEAF